jgi:cytochrome oxidase Cu insertion factor (SCO1/SenC/PrrC family)
VDPARDSPAAIRSFLAVRNANGTMDYLIGSLREMIPVWKLWGIGVNVAGKQVTVGHTSIVFGITASGRVVDVYPANFNPAQIVHDAPLLAGE